MGALSGTGLVSGLQAGPAAPVRGGNYGWDPPVAEPVEGLPGGLGALCRGWGAAQIQQLRTLLPASLCLGCRQRLSSVRPRLLDCPHLQTLCKGSQLGPQVRGPPGSPVAPQGKHAFCLEPDKVPLALGSYHRNRHMGQDWRQVLRESAGRAMLAAVPSSLLDTPNRSSFLKGCGPCAGAGRPGQECCASPAPA